MKNSEKTLPLEPAEDMPVDTADDGQLRQLIEDADQTYRASAMVGNMSAASAALNTKLRALNEQARRAEARSERQELLLGSDPADPSTWSPEVGVFIRSYMDSILERSAATAEKEAVSNED